MLPTALTPQPTPTPSRGFWFMRDIPSGLWLALTLVAVFAQQALPAPRWLMIHLLLLGAATHAIFVWSQYFSFALLRSRSTAVERSRQNARLVLANAGAVLVVVGVPMSLPALTLAGAVALIVAVVWHGVNLAVRLRGSLPGKFGRTIRYYIAASGMLALGAGLGATAAFAGSHLSLLGSIGLAHALVNVLGWLGITIAGTLVTLWPTILRTRADDFAARGASRALPWLIAGTLAAAAGAAFAWLPVLIVGLVAYLVGLGTVAVSGWRAARKAPPRSFAALSVGFGFLWWIAALLTLVFGLGITLVRSWSSGDGGEIDGLRTMATLLRGAVPYLAAGFVAQVLAGALSYLIPVVFGGGPRAVKAGTAVLNRAAWLRIVAANLGLVVTLLPVLGLFPEPIARPLLATAAAVYVAAMAVFLLLMMLSMPAQRRAKQRG